MKLIKFDLPLNGQRIRSIEELRDNFTTDILAVHASGLLVKWLRVRDQIEVANSVASIETTDDIETLLTLCEIFGVEADRQVAEAALAPPPPSQGVPIQMTMLDEAKADLADLKDEQITVVRLDSESCPELHALMKDNAGASNILEVALHVRVGNTVMPGQPLGVGTFETDKSVVDFRIIAPVGGEISDIAAGGAGSPPKLNDALCSIRTKK
jgi:hypothetical protein